MTVVWSPRALRDLDGILGYLQERSRQGAHNVSHAIERSVAICDQHLQLGSKTDLADVYRWPLVTYRYTFFYRFAPGSSIEIICLLPSSSIRSLRRIPDER
jgi:plasmid stabilization system protein ParE